MFSDNSFGEDSLQFPMLEIGFPLHCVMKSLESFRSPSLRLSIQNNFQYILFLGIPYKPH